MDIPWGPRNGQLIELDHDAPKGASRSTGLAVVSLSQVRMGWIRPAKPDAIVANAPENVVPLEPRTGGVANPPAARRVADDLR